RVPPPPPLLPYPTPFRSPVPAPEIPRGALPPTARPHYFSHRPAAARTAAVPPPSPGRAPGRPETPAPWPSHSSAASRSPPPCWRSEEHTSELQSPDHLVC